MLTEPLAPLTRRRAVSALAGAVLWPAGAGASTLDRQQEHLFLFGSPVDLIVRTENTQQGAQATASVVAGLERLNREWNAWKPGELGRLNDALRQGRSERVAPDLLALIRLSLDMERRTGGLFNAGVGGAVAAWGFHADVMRPGARPDAAALASWRRAAPSLSQLVLEGNLVHSGNPRLQLDFGAIAKGVAIDRAMHHLRAMGVSHAVINLGGNLATMGDAGGRAWQIGIRDPEGEGLLALVDTSGREAVVTSGTYERFRVLDGERVGHVIDPRNAAPATGLVSVTVLHRSAALADAAATALLVAGPARWHRVARQMGVDQALVVDHAGRGQVTPRLASRLHTLGPHWHRRLIVQT
jgi:thiamine biosynthesis lipoprotein